MTDFRPTKFQVLPLVVKNIIIINVLMVLIQYTLGRFNIDLADYLGLHYWGSTLFRPWQLLTHIFMHGSKDDVEMTVLHIASNMFGLWMFGSILENAWGPKRFLIFYIVCGLGAAVCHLAVLHYEFSGIINGFQAYQQNTNLDQFQRFLNQYVPKALPNPTWVNSILQRWSNDPGNMQLKNESIRWINAYIYGVSSNTGHISGLIDQATVGASGAVFGVLFAYGYLYPNSLMMLIFLPIPIKAKYFIAIYAAFELFSGIKNSAGDNVAHFAHLGGMLFAFILLKIWDRTYRDKYY